ncbi:MAG: hypothetical protein ABI288_09680 [Ginsengibacter sp.]
MKKLFISLLAIGFFVSTGNAQVQRDVTRSQKVQSDSSRHYKKGKMMNDLNLTADQKSQMKEMQQSGKQQRETIKNDASLTPDQKKEKMKDLQKSQSAKVNTILTPEQQSQRKTHMEKMKSSGQMQGRKGHYRGNKNSNTSQDASQS